MEKIKGITPGRIVHYVLGDGDARESNIGEHRPAIIVKVWDEYSGCSQLQVFMDGDGSEGFNDERPNVEWKTSVNYSEEKEPSTWHWIEPA